MHAADRLRLRLMAVLATGTLAATACGGSVEDRRPAGGTTVAPTPPKTETAPPKVEVGECEWGTPEDVCIAPGEMPGWVDQTGPFGDSTGDPSSGEVAANGCPVADRIMDGCCNTASYGPWREGDDCCYRICTGGCCGRPFLVDDVARLATTTERSDWLDRVDSPDPSDLDPATRRRLSDAWLEDARMEHASIASFARFTLELLALGAPADLVEACQQAALDEVAHAKLCYGMAARYGQIERGPGALPTEDALAPTSLVDCAVGAVLEGCVGETLAAVLASEQATRATDPRARAVLLRIAEDESRHAELAWSFVRWAIERGGRSVQRAVRTAFRRARAADAVTVTEGPMSANLAAWRAHGRLTERERLAATERAWRDVIEPCSWELMAADSMRDPTSETIALAPESVEPSRPSSAG